ncbi:MAG: tRNA (adenosine(37)-N6)-threonylcarbamoyltransferase complex dimerization subunit type 1 TsaB [Kordiimonadaceae bacterium]|nr:tRNA (adenosine(37)-N6)-threonylcarbamoyltransferase complex dimerization subunit type 1 TsaB [Kordiimonadaceae bacterium]
MTHILAIDTTLGACSAALIKEGTITSYKCEVRVRGHVERLLPMIDEICEESGIKISDIENIAVTVGPGTFAGVRIGLSAAKGMALALDIKVVPVTTLEAIICQFVEEEKGFKGKVAVAIDARRGEIYFQIFDVDKGTFKAISTAEAIPISKIGERITSDLDLLIGSGAEFLSGLKILSSKKYNFPDALYIAQYAEKKLGFAVRSDDISPLYLRAPDAIKPAPLNMIVSNEE